ncbi:sigma-70 family RNA polymerase sigma factor [Aquibacillus saliphilus]|uniref:sigma-70 family RNA polymerase sigma factor n=1 Tax=Aquibacillus saliphilus TaxID=1909422 RepID=UPI001CEFE88C
MKIIAGLDEVIEDYERMIYDIMHKLLKTNRKNEIEEKLSLQGMALEDFIQEGKIVIIKAQKSYNPDLQVKFGTYVYRIIYNKMITLLKRNHLIHYPDSMEYTERLSHATTTKSTSQPLSHTATLTYEDIIMDEADTIDGKIMEMDIKEAFNMLNERSRDVLIKYYQGMTFTQIADHYGISRQAVSKMNIREVKKLRKKLTGYGHSRKRSEVSETV